MPSRNSLKTSAGKLPVASQCNRGAMLLLFQRIGDLLWNTTVCSSYVLAIQRRNIVSLAF